MRNQHLNLRVKTTSGLPRAIKPVLPLGDQQPYSLTLTHSRFHFRNKLTPALDSKTIKDFQGND